MKVQWWTFTLITRVDACSIWGRTKCILWVVVLSLVVEDSCVCVFIPFWLLALGCDVLALLLLLFNKSKEQPLSELGKKPYGLVERYHLRVIGERVRCLYCNYFAWPITSYPSHNHPCMTRRVKHILKRVDARLVYSSCPPLWKMWLEGWSPWVIEITHCPSLRDCYTFLYAFAMTKRRVKLSRM